MKKKIAVMNEFSVKNISQGSRGNSPGGFIRDYISREAACKPGYHPDFVQRQQMIQQILDTEISQQAAEEQLKELDDKSGVAFDEENLFLPDEDLRQKADSFQDYFDDGKTILKTVVSFDFDYLQNAKIIPSDLKKAEVGYNSLEDKTDLARLHLAIREGVRSIAPKFDHLEWIGVIHTNTRNIHCHLVLADTGTGNLRKNGTQNGLFGAKMKEKMRLTIDSFLHENQRMKHFPSVSQEEKNLSQSIQIAVSSKTMSRPLALEHLEQILPKDSSLWKAESTHPAMRQANQIAAEIVERSLNQPDSPFRDFINRRAETVVKTNWPIPMQEQWMKKQKQLLTDRCINALYDHMRQPVKQSVKQSGPDYTNPKKETVADPVQDQFDRYCMRIKTASSRLEKHQRKAMQLDQAIQSYKNLPHTSNASRAMLEFFEIERAYHQLCMEKYWMLYRHLPKDLYQEWEEILEARAKIEALKMQGYSETEIQNLEDRVDHQQKKVAYKLELYGFIPDANNELQKIDPANSLKQIRYIDLHEMKGMPKLDGNDPAVQQFKDMALKRYEAMRKAIDYLDSTGQARFIKTLPVKEIFDMQETAFPYRREDREPDLEDKSATEIYEEEEKEEDTPKKTSRQKTKEARSVIFEAVRQETETVPEIEPEIEL